jgi:predicted DNA-binding transcriptional regulator AlpA
MLLRTGARPQFWSVGEVAEILGVHRTTVFRWVKAKILPEPIYLTPDRPAFSRAEIDAWIAERTAARPPPPAQAA